MNPNLTEVYGSQVLFDGLSLLYGHQEEPRGENVWLIVGTPVVDGIFGSLSTPFLLSWQEISFEDLGKFSLLLKSLLFPLHFPSMDSYVTIVWTEWLWWQVFKIQSLLSVIELITQL